MASPTAAYVDATGIHAPPYEDILSYLQAQFRLIYGADAYLEPDSQDGQLLAIFALAISDSNSAAIAAYNSYSPTTAQGVGLSQAVRINGITRNVPSFGTVDLLITGVPTSFIENGVASDEAQNKWLLPYPITIPDSGSVTVTAQAATMGAIEAAPNTITTIATPTRGWLAVTNPAAAAPGEPVETDAELRLRQALSTEQPSSTILDGVTGAIYALADVIDVKSYENDTNSTDANGLPAHSVSFVVHGGNSYAIASVIAKRKTPGAYTYGTTTESVVDQFGNAHDIRFYRPTEVPIKIVVTLHNLTGYSTVIGQEIVSALVAYFASYNIGADVLYTKLYVPANLSGADGATFDITSIAIDTVAGGTPAAANVTIAFNEVATLDPSNVTITVV